AAIEPHARRVILRFGVVLDPSGGALAVMRRPFKLGLGGRLGSGRQWMSWITLEDVCGIVLRALHDDTWRGIYNAVAPHPVRNTDFARELGRALRRPAKLPVPATALRMVLGGAMADEMLLASARVVPERLRAAGFRFRDPVLGDALRRLLARPRAWARPAGRGALRGRPGARRSAVPARLPSIGPRARRVRPPTVHGSWL